MKQIKFILLGLVAAFAMVGCGDKTPVTPDKPHNNPLIIGQWEMTSAAAEYAGKSVYAEFAENGYFNAYVDNDTYNGRYNCTDDKLTVNVNGGSVEYDIVLTSSEMTVAGSKFTKSEIPLDITCSIVGQWVLKAWANATENLPEVYIEFTEYGNFYIYQHCYTSYFSVFSGTYDLSDDFLLRGLYSTGYSLATSYDVTFTAKEMILTRIEDPDDVSVYVKGVIPNDIIEATPMTTKAAGDVVPFL